MEGGHGYFGNRRVVPREMVCLSYTCMICKDGRRRETHNIRRWKKAEEAEKSEPLNRNSGVMGSIGHTHLIWRF